MKTVVKLRKKKPGEAPIIVEEVVGGGGPTIELLWIAGSITNGGFIIAPTNDHQVGDSPVSDDEAYYAVLFGVEDTDSVSWAFDWTGSGSWSLTHVSGPVAIINADSSPNFPGDGTGTLTATHNGTDYVATISFAGT